MPPAYLLDSSVCVAVLRGRAALSAVPAQDETAVSSIVAGELWVVVQKSSRVGAARQLQEFFDVFVVMAFDHDAAKAYGRVRADLERREQKIGLLDLLIAAHALSLGATLLTGNVGEFRRVDCLQVQAWQ